MTIADQVTTANLFADLADDREGASQYLSIFIDEAQSTLDELIEALLALETGGGKKQVEQLFIAAHRMKGSAALIGLNRIAKLSHLMEDLLQTLVDQGAFRRRKSPTPCCHAPTACGGASTPCKAAKSWTTRFAALAQELLAADRGSAETATAPATPVPTNSATSESPADAGERPSTSAAEISNVLRKHVSDATLAEQRDDVVVGQIVFEANLPLVSLKALLLSSKLANVGEIRYLNPPAEAMETLEEIAAIEFAVVTNKNPEVVRTLLQVAGVASVVVEPLERRQTLTAAPLESRAAEAAAKPAETLRVDIERLDELMNLAGQLVIGKARITQISDGLKKSVAEKDLSTPATASPTCSRRFICSTALATASSRGDEHADAPHRAAVQPLPSRDPRPDSRQRERHSPGDQRRRHGTRQTHDRRARRPDDSRHPQRRRSRHRIAAGPRCRRQAPARHHQALRLPSRQQHHHSSSGRRARARHRADPARKAIERGIVSAADAERLTPRRSIS